MTTWRQVFALGPSAMPLAMRARLGLPTIALLVAPALFGHFLLGLLMGLGSYSVLFGAVPRRRHRAVVMAVTGVGLVAAVCAGVAVAGSLAASLAAYVIAAFLGVVLDEVVPLGPPGPYFFVLMVGGGGVVGQAGIGAAAILPWLCLGAVVAFVAAVAGRDDPRARMPRIGVAGLPHRVADRLRWPGREARVFWRVVLAIGVVQVVMTALGDPHPFWAVLAAGLVLMPPKEPGALGLRAAHRVLGTLVGALAYEVWVSLVPGSVPAFLAMGVLLWLVMALSPRNYGYACVGITLLALLMTQELTPGVPPGALAGNRVLDTVVGGVVALVVLMILRPRRGVSAGESD